MILTIGSAANRGDGAGKSKPFGLSFGALIGGSMLWALAMGASAYLNLMMDGWETASKAHFVTMLFAAGGASAFAPGFRLARFFQGRRGAEGAYAAAILSFAVTTIGATAAFYALHYRFYYAQWHAEAFTVTWMFQFVFTTLAALYQFAVLGVRLFFPFGFVALFGIALWFARRPR